MTFSRPLRWLVFPVVLAVALAGVLSSCGGESPSTGQLKVTGLVTTCGPNDVNCRTSPAEGAEVEVSGGATSFCPRCSTRTVRCGSPSTRASTRLS